MLHEWRWRCECPGVVKHSALPMGLPMCVSAFVPACLCSSECRYLSLMWLCGSCPLTSLGLSCVPLLIWVCELCLSRGMSHALTEILQISVCLYLSLCVSYAPAVHLCVCKSCPFVCDPCPCPTGLNLCVQVTPMSSKYSLPVFLHVCDTSSRPLEYASLLYMCP